MADVKDWGTQASDNNVASPDGAQSGWVGADAGPWARETMAGVARWHADPAWVNFMRFGLTPTGNKSVVRTGDSQIEITTSGAAWASATTDVFSVGRLIRAKATGGNYFYGFISGRSIASSVLTVDLALLGASSIPGGTVFDQNGVEFYVGFDTVDDSTSGPRTVQALAAFAFGGAGTIAERNTRFPVVSFMPEGILWANTTDNVLQIIAGTSGSRTWRSIAPLRSVWSNGGSDLTLNNASGTSTFSINPSTGSEAVCRLMESSTVRSRFLYDPVANITAIEGGDLAGTAGRIFIQDSDGRPYLQLYSGGTPGSALNMTPGELNAGQINGVDGVIQNCFPRARTGGGSQITVGNAWTLLHSGTLPAAVEELLESSGWDELEIDITYVLQSTFSTSPSQGARYQFHLFLGDDLHITPPSPLSSGEQAWWEINSYPNYNPYIEKTGRVFGVGFAGTLRRSILNADLSGNINSFAIAITGIGLGNPQQVTWLENSGNRYSSISFQGGYRVVT